MRSKNLEAKGRERDSEYQLKEKEGKGKERDT
jgi:hypothetical protein